MSRLSPKTQLVVILTALAIIPLTYASLLVWSVKDPTGSLDVMSAAIVNEDSPTTGDDDNELQLGDDLTEELLDSDEGFAWQTMSAQQAHDALADGDIRAILEIPEDFSESAASLGDSDPLDAAKSQLSITTNDASNIIAGNIAATVGEAVRSSVSQQVGEEFLAQVTVGFTDIAESLDEAADGADELADGTASAHDGAGDLVVGLDTLSGGAVDLSDGASQLAAGTLEAADEAAELSDGLATLNEQTQGLPDTARTIDTKANELATGAQDIADDVASASSTVDGLATDLDQTLSSAQQLDGSASELVESTTSAGEDNDGLAADSQALLDNWDELSEEERESAVQDIAHNASSARDTIASAQEQAQTLGQDASAVLGSGSTDQGASGISDMTTDIADLQELLQSVHDGTDRADEGSQIIYDGADRLTSATSDLVGGADELSGAIDAAATGASELSTGLTSLTDGAEDLDTGTSELVDGTVDAQSGAGELHSGLQELDTGADDLATGLDDGRDEVPRYSDAEGEHLAETASDPVELNDERLHEVTGYGWGLAPYFMSLALWVGAMGYFLMRPAINTRQIATSGSALRAIVGGITPAFVMAFVQSTLMVTFVRFVVGIDMANTAGVYALSFFASLAFFMLNQMLIAAFGPPGRFFALVLIVLQLSAAGGTYPIETAPAFLQSLHSWLPMTHSVDGLRTLIAGGAFDSAAVLLPIGAWLIVGLSGLAIAIVAVWRKAHRTHETRKHVDNSATPQEYAADSG